MCPHLIKDVETILLGCSNRLGSYALSWSWMWFTSELINIHDGMSHAVKWHFYLIVFTRLHWHRLCCNRICELGCAMTGSHIKWGLYARSSLWVCSFSLEADVNLESQAKLMPMQGSCNTPTITMPTNGKNAILNKKLEGWEFTGGSESFKNDAHLLGVMSWLFGL